MKIYSIILSFILLASCGKQETAATYFDERGHYLLAAADSVQNEDHEQLVENLEKFQELTHDEAFIERILLTVNERYYIEQVNTALAAGDLNQAEALTDKAEIEVGALNQVKESSKSIFELKAFEAYLSGRPYGSAELALKSLERIPMDNFSKLSSAFALWYKKELARIQSQRDVEEHYQGLELLVELDHAQVEGTPRRFLILAELLKFQPQVFEDKQNQFAQEINFFRIVSMKGSANFAIEVRKFPFEKPVSQSGAVCAIWKRYYSGDRVGALLQFNEYKANLSKNTLQKVRELILDDLNQNLRGDSLGIDTFFKDLKNWDQ
ncbi:MAG: hypothetical protein MK193_01285 [Lentisphaeria bacterium]|nr:hypothetical protein [Lentisphaeria bacterium]